ncbi:MAG TPA: hypothetical protein DIT64_20625 [Verrucomicrobiales bacterium]|nr:hypothetical protein [Verrucomicrobiales bacterium]
MKKAAIQEAQLLYSRFTDAGPNWREAGAAMKTHTHPILQLTLKSILALAMLPLAALAKPDKDKPGKPVNDDEALVQIALLLDTSNSMDGLIEQAKTQLWKIVNEFNDAKQDGKAAVVQVALYEYGNNNLSAGTNYIRLVQPFTRDLDKVSEHLFKLTTNGGQEYCGAVVREAVDKLAWDAGAGVYKAVFIAGNEPFTQGPVNPNDACRAAIQRGIVVNTIHCGSQAEGENGGWRTGAALAEGKFMTIDQDKAIVRVQAPQDKEIARLSIELNKTYISYGKEGPAASANQMAQDQNAAANAASGAEVQRAVTKISRNYDNSGWDLVDAVKRKRLAPGALKPEELPEEFKGLSEAEIKARIEAKAAERERIQAEIKKLNDEREKFIAEKAREKGESDTLDVVIGKAVREQAAKVRIEFK